MFTRTRLLLLSACMLASTIAFAESIWISAELANVRSAPGMKSDVIALAGVGTKGERIDTQGSWAKVRLLQGGVTAEGWVHSSLISVATVAPVEGKTMLTLVQAAVVLSEAAKAGERFRVTAESAIVRSRADAAADMVTAVPRGTEIALVAVLRYPDSREEWAQVLVTATGEGGFVLMSEGARVGPPTVPVIDLNAAAEANAKARAAEEAEREKERKAFAEQLEADREAHQKAFTDTVEQARLAREAAEKAAAAQEETVKAVSGMQEMLNRQEQHAKERVLAYDYTFGLSGGTADPGNGRGMYIEGGGVFAFRRKNGIWFQGAVMLERSKDLRRYGVSGGAGYEKIYDSGQILGGYVFIDDLQWQLPPGAMTSHVQVRPVVRWQRSRWSLSGYAGIPLSAEKLASENVEQTWVPGADGTHHITTTTRIFNKALLYGGGSIRADVTRDLSLSAAFEFAESSAYRLSFDGQYLLGSGLYATFGGERTDYGDYPLLGYSGYGYGWSARVGLAYGRAGNGALRDRMLIAPSWPMVVQRQEISLVDELVYDIFDVTAVATPDSGAHPLYVLLTAIPNGGKPPFSYLWEYGDKSTGRGRVTGHVYAKPGRYTATVTARDALMQSANASAVIVVTGGTLVVSCTANPTSGEAPLEVQFAASAQGGTGQYTWKWAFGDGQTSTEKNPSHVYKHKGTYTSVVTCTSDGLSDTCQRVIEVTDDQPSELKVQCVASTNEGNAPLKVILSAAASGGTPPYTYKWRFGDGSTDVGDTVEHVYRSEGIYRAVVTAYDAKGKKANCFEMITVNSGPGDLDVTCSADKTVVMALGTVNFTAQATGGVGNYSYRWNFSDGGSASTQNVSHRYECEPGTYTATVTVTSGTQKAQCEVRVTVKSPSIKLQCSGSPQSGSAPLTVQFDVTLSGNYDPDDVTIYWDFGDGSWSADKSPQHTYTSAGSYESVVIVTTGCTSDSCSVRVTVN